MSKKAQQSLKSILYRSTITQSNSIKLQNAFKIYNSSNAIRTDPQIINLILKICLNTNHPERASIIWNDIKSNTSTTPLHCISFPLLIKCCLQGNTDSTETIIDCTFILKWLKHHEYQIQYKDRKDYSINISSLISKCQDFEQLSSIHSLIDDDDIFIKTALINKYGHFQHVDAALFVFHSVNDTQKDSVILGAIMTALNDNEGYIQSLSIYHEHQTLHNEVVHILALQACIAIDDENTGRAIHNALNETDYIHNNINLKNCLIDFYGHFKDLNTAMDLFEDGAKDSISVNSMMSAFIRNQQYNSAVSLYETYGSFRNYISDILLFRALTLCNDLSAFERGKMIHSTSKKDLSKDTQLINVMIEFYSHYGDIEKARNLFNGIDPSDRDIGCIVTMMRIYDSHQHYRCILDLYDEIDNRLKDGKVKVLYLRACKHLGESHQGIRVYDEVVSSELQHIGGSLVVALLDFCNYFGEIGRAKRLFKCAMASKEDVLVLNEMMKLYTKNDKFDDVLNLHRSCGHLIDDVSHVLALKACVQLKDKKRGKEIHDLIGDHSQSEYLQTALIDFYGNIGDMDSAQGIFEEISDEKQHIAVINAMMDAYCENQMESECITLFEGIKNRYGLSPDFISYATVLKACTQSTSFHYGRQIHEHLMTDDSNGILKNIDVQINLINLYGKCGRLDLCDEIFEGIERGQPDMFREHIAIWNAMMHSYGRNGELRKCLEIFHRMNKEIGFEPNEKTCAILLNACNHSGDVDTAMNIWNNVISDERVKYDRFVMTSLIDCVVRKGLVMRGKELVMEYEAYWKSVKQERGVRYQLENEAMWMILLNACKTYGDGTNGTTSMKTKQNLTRGIYDEIQQRFGHDEHRMAAASVILSNVYAE